MILGSRDPWTFASFPAMSCSRVDVSMCKGDQFQKVLRVEHGASGA